MLEFLQQWPQCEAAWMPQILFGRLGGRRHFWGGSAKFTVRVVRSFFWKSFVTGLRALSYLYIIERPHCNFHAMRVMLVCSSAGNMLQIVFKVWNGSSIYRGAYTLTIG